MYSTCCKRWLLRLRAVNAINPGRTYIKPMTRATILTRAKMGQVLHNSCRPPIDHSITKSTMIYIMMRLPFSRLYRNYHREKVSVWSVDVSLIWVCSKLKISTRRKASTRSMKVSNLSRRHKRRIIWRYSLSTSVATKQVALYTRTLVASMSSILEITVDSK